MQGSEDSIRLRHMLDHAREAFCLIREKSRTDIEADRVLQLALVRLLEILGEAGARVSEETRSRCADIPWLAIIGLRNRLIHGYDAIDFGILWQILSADLPALIPALERALAEETDT